MKHKYLPLGSVVLLNGGEKELMIIGYQPIVTEGNEKKKFDYSGCYYPEGVLSSDESYLFNHNMIEKICFLGYETNKSTKYIQELSQVYESDSNEEKKEVLFNKTNIFESLRQG